LIKSIIKPVVVVVFFWSWCDGRLTTYNPLLKREWWQTQKNLRLSKLVVNSNQYIFSYENTKYRTHFTRTIIQLYDVRICLLGVVIPQTWLLFVETYHFCWKHGHTVSLTCQLLSTLQYYYRSYNWRIYNICVEGSEKWEPCLPVAQNEIYRLEQAHSSIITHVLLLHYT